MIIKEPISSFWQYVMFGVFILLAIVFVVACAVLYDTRTPETVVIDSPKTIPVTDSVTIHTHTIKCTHYEKFFCSEYKVYKVIKD